MSLKTMNSPIKSALALLVVFTVGQSAPGIAQTATGFEPIEELSTAKSKMADIDILTDSPTLHAQASTYAQQQPQQPGFAQNTFAAPSYQPAQNTAPVQYGAPAGNALDNPMPAQYAAQYAAPVQNGMVAQQPIQPAKAPIQISSDTVGRVVGVAGTALLLGAFLKNGGVGGMFNTLGLDCRFHSRGPSIGGY